MEDRGAAVHIIGWTFVIAAGSMVALRLISRLKLSDMRGWDDLYIAIAWIVILIDTCFASYAVSLGLGKHIKTLTPEAAIHAVKWSVITLTGNIFVFTLPKPAIAVLLGRILSIGNQPSNKHRIFLYGPATVIVLISFVGCGIWLGQCKPIQALWNKYIEARCLNPHIFLGVSMAGCILSAFLDFFYGIYPIFFISKLQMGLRRKINLCLMLGLACIGGAVAIWKITQLPAGVNPTADVTYDSAPLVYATLIEGNVIIIMSCIPTIGPVALAARRKMEKFRSRLSRIPTSYRQFYDQGGPLSKDGQMPPSNELPQSRDCILDGPHKSGDYELQHMASEDVASSRSR